MAGDMFVSRASVTPVVTERLAGERTPPPGGVRTPFLAPSTPNQTLQVPGAGALVSADRCSSSAISCSEDPALSHFLELGVEGGGRTCCRPAFTQWMSAIAVWYTVALASGAELGHSALLAQHSAEQGRYVESYWREALPVLAMLPGCVLSAIVMSSFGRRKPLIYIAVPLTLRWVLTLYEHPATILAGVTLGAICRGFVITLAPIYLGEISDIKLRGSFLACIALFETLGALFVQTLGMIVSPLMINKVLATMSAIISTFLLIPSESPYWLILRGKRVEAMKVFGSVRGYHITAIKELKQLLDIECKDTLYSYKSLSVLFKLEFVKPTALLVSFNVLLAFCGIYNIDSYTVNTFQQISDSEWSPALVQLSMLIIKSLLLIFASILCRKSRRSICIWSCVSIFVSTLIYTLHYVLSTSGSMPSVLWISFACYIGYSCSLTVGLLPLSWVLSGELMPLRARGLSSCIVTFAAVASYFASSRAIQLITLYSDSAALYILYGLCGLIFALVMNNFLLETRCMTLCDVQRKYKKASFEN